MATPRPSIEIFNQTTGQVTGHEAIFGHGANQTLIATGTGVHHTLASSGIGSNLLIGGLGTNVFEYKSTTFWPGYASQNVGDPGNPGPNTLFSLGGYAQSTDVFHGQAGATNILWMANGKAALFLDDGFSPGVDSLRLTNIDIIQCATGDKIVDLTSTRYSLGNVTIVGGTGNDVMMSSVGDDTIIAGKGNDYMWGGSGNDAFVYTAAMARGFTDTAIGANGVDTLKIKLTAAEFTTAVKAELNAYHNFISDTHNSNGSFTFHSLGNLTATAMERLDVSVNGVHVAIGTSAAKQTLEGGRASHTLTGGTGGDTFFWKTADVGHGVDHVTNFSFEQMDRFDFTRLAMDHTSANVANSVQAIDTAAGTLLQVHLNGTSGWTDVAVLDHVHNVTVHDLIQSHSFIL